MILYEWDGISFVPLSRFQKKCDEEYVVGEIYAMEVKEFRSMASHNHYFAQVADYWANLPELIAPSFPTPEHLRKFALIKCGYYNQTSHVEESKSAAQKLAAFIKPMDDFALVTVNECEVCHYTAKSQSTKAMGKRVFQESKEAVLTFLEDLVIGQAA